MAFADPSISNSTTPQLEGGSLASHGRKKQGEIERFESVLKLRDTHPFGPKGTLARWLDEFSETGEEGTSPPPMA